MIGKTGRVINCPKCKGEGCEYGIARTKKIAGNLWECLECGEIFK